MKNVLLIINPVSGKKSILPKLFDIINELCKAECNVTVHVTLHRNHAVELAQSASIAGFDTVICCGGDGTLNETLTGLCLSKSNDDIKLGYIPCGSTNDFADTLGLDSTPENQIKNIINQNETLLDVGLFENKRYFSYIASFGAFTDAAYSAPQDLKNRFGHFAYVLEGAKDLTKIEPIKATIIADGKEYSGNYVFGSVSNTKSVAGIVKLKDDIVDLNDGQFEVLLVKFPEDIIDFFDIMTGASQSDFRSDMFDFFRAKDIKFKFEKDIPWTLDGEEARGGKNVEIKVCPSAVRLLK